MTFYNKQLQKAICDYLNPRERPLNQRRPTFRERWIKELENRPGLILIAFIMFWLLLSLLFVLGNGPYYVGGV
jgi:hypothetical protein